MSPFFFDSLRILEDSPDSVTSIPEKDFWLIFGSIFAVFVVIGLIDAFIYLYRYKKKEKKQREELEKEAAEERRRQEEKKNHIVK